MYISCICYIIKNNMSINNILKKQAAINFFQIEVIADLKFEGETYKNVKQRNNDSFLTPDNWHDKKDIFFKQRLETYKDSYTLTQKINLEIEDLDNLPTSETDYKILVDNYKNYLLTKLQKPEQTEIKKPDTVEKELYPEIFKSNAFEIWQSMFNHFKITQSSYSTDIDFMFEILKYNNLIHDNIRLIDIKNWINKTYEISFEKIRYTNPKSTANKTRLAIYNEIIAK